jgi:DNA-binding SARP family transcriptional activator/tetratricopeptide (TPR) repeat protein
MAARLSLTLLGGFRARVGARPLGVPLRKARALLAYLALTPGRAHTREELAALLWGDRADAHARNSLRQTLFGLRTALAAARAPCLELAADVVALRPGAIDVDVAAFERLAVSSSDDDLAAAAAMYRGDLLAGLSVADPGFEEWLACERERLRHLAVVALTRLLDHQLDSASPEQAIATARRLLALDPLQESVHRTLMRLCLERGQRAAALRQYRACAATLQRELGTEPEPETKALYRRIVQAGAGDAADVADPSAEATPLVGRRRELTALLEQLAAAGAGRGRIVAVLGEAGIGKTRLTEELGLRAVGQDWRVLRAQAHETERILPFAPWAEALREPAVALVREAGNRGPTWARDLARLFPELAPGRSRNGAGDTLSLFEALAQLVIRLAEGQALLLVLDDLHWADDASLRFLAFLGRRLSRWPVLIVVTARVEELDGPAILGPTLAELREGRCLVSLPLAPLPRPDTEALITALRPSIATSAAREGLIEHVWAMSEGNPFVVVEAMRSLPPGNAPTPTAPALPERVQEIILARLQRASDGAQRLVAVAAVIGRGFSFALLQRASGLDPRQAADGVEELIRQQVLRDVGEQFDFSHDRIRQAVYAHLLVPRRRLLHAEVAAALEEVHRDDLAAHVSALAIHYEIAERWDKAVTYLRAAGAEAARRGAYRQAVSLFERALAALPRLPGDRCARELAVDLRLDLRDWLMPLGELSRLRAYLDEAHALATELGDERRIALASGHLAHCLWLCGEPGRALTLARRTARAARALRDVALEILGNFYLGEVCHQLGDYARAVRYLARNGELAKGERALQRFAGPGLVPLQSRLWLALSLSELGRCDEAVAIAEEAHAAAEAVNHPYSLAFAKSTLGRLHLSRGAPETAIPVLEQALRLIQSRGIALNLAGTRSHLGYAYVLTGRIAEGLPMLADAVAQAAELRRSGRALLVGRLAEALLWTQHRAEALERGREALGLARVQHERGLEAWALAVMGDVYVGQAPPALTEAGQHYRDALALARTLGMRPLQRRCEEALQRLPA